MPTLPTTVVTATLATPEKKGNKKSKKEETVTVPTQEGQAPAEQKPEEKPAEQKAPATPKVKGPNDLTAAEARCLAIAADGIGRLNAEFYSIPTDVLGCGTKTGGSPGLVGRGFLEVKVIEAQEGRRGGNAYFITAKGREVLALQPDVPGLTAKACAMEATAKEKFFAKRAAKKAAKPEAAATTVPDAPKPEAAAEQAPAPAPVA